MQDVSHGPPVRFRRAFPCDPWQTDGARVRTRAGMGTDDMRLAVHAAAVFAAAVMWFAAVTGAQAGQCGYDYCWGAVTVGPNGAYGFSHGHFSEQAAIEAANQGCSYSCNLTRTFYNTCGAIAMASNGGWGWAWGPSRTDAEGLALQYCYPNGPNCRVRVWACSY